MPAVQKVLSSVSVRDVCLRLSLPSTPPPNNPEQTLEHQGHISHPHMYTEKSPGLFHPSPSKEHLGPPTMPLPMFRIPSLIRPDQ